MDRINEVDPLMEETVPVMPKFEVKDILRKVPDSAIRIKDFKVYEKQEDLYSLIL